MNQSSIDPALRHAPGPSFASPPKRGSQIFSDGIQNAGYASLQPSPSSSYRGGPTPTPYYPTNQEHHDSAEEHSPSGANPSDPNDLKRPRACEACRQLKVKCEFDESNPAASCKRCAKANRQCVVTAPSRKRQKKTDSRVAELEKKIDALTASLVARGGVEDTPLDPAIAQPRVVDAQSTHNSTYPETQWGPPSRQSSINAQPQLAAGAKRKLPTDYGYFGGELLKTTATPPPKHPMEQPGAFSSAFPADGIKRKGSDEGVGYVDIIDRKLIDAETAYRCFDRYCTEMCRQLPLVVFPPGTRAEEVRKSKPMLFLACVAVATGTIRPDLQVLLVNEATQLIADKIVFRGEKSLEMIQFVQVMTIFYSPPDRYEELNFNQLIHIAAVMAFDCGMGKRTKVGTFGMGNKYLDQKKTRLLDPDAAETRRCWLGCYYMCSNSAMSLRRPVLLRWGPYTEESIEILNRATDALPTDKFLCHLVRAQHIAEDVGFRFCMDDPASPLSLMDERIQYALKAFELELEDWHDSWASDPDIYRQPLIKHSEAIINLYMHEIAMHHNHNIDDFKPPYNINSEEGPTEPDFVTPAHIDALTIVLSSIHSAFDAFLVMDVTVLRALPTLFFVRNSYAAVALIKMFSAVSANGSKFGTVFKPKDLKVEWYLDQLIDRLAKTAEGNASRVAYKFSFIFNMLKSWHLKRTEASASGPPRNTTKPFVLAQSSEQQKTQDSNTLAWNDNTAAGQNLTAPNQGTRRSGLEMLSDASAMIKNPANGNASNSQLTHLGPASTNGGQWQQGGNMPGMTPLAEMPMMGDGTVMGYGFPTPGGGMDSMTGFMDGEMMMMGNLVDDPGWFSFGLEQGGWAF